MHCNAKTNARVCLQGRLESYLVRIHDFDLSARICAFCDSLRITVNATSVKKDRSFVFDMHFLDFRNKCII